MSPRRQPERRGEPRQIVGAADARFVVVSFFDDDGRGQSRAAVIFGENTEAPSVYLFPEKAMETPNKWLRDGILSLAGRKERATIPKIPDDNVGSLGDSRSGAPAKS